MADQYKSCPNCGTEIKDSLFGGNPLLSARKIAVINEFAVENKAQAYCGKCGSSLYARGKERALEEKKQQISLLEKHIASIPVVSAHNPLNWQYTILDMVTGQSTTGTGVLSEFTSSFTDLFGVQSGAFNSKLRQGENLCFSQLRKKALDLGGNAVIGTDIDYSEVGGIKGMLMVCMAGTAIKLNNPEVLGEERAAWLKTLIKIHARLQFINSMEI